MAVLGALAGHSSIPPAAGPHLAASHRGPAIGCPLFQSPNDL
jgi:hypothetical protein